MNDDAIFLPVHLENKPTNNFSYHELSGRATELDLLPMSNSSRSKISSYTGWVKENFPNHFSPKILAHLKNGFVQRLVRWDKSEGSPLFDFSYLEGTKRITEISHESSGHKSDFFHGHCRRWHPNGVLAMESDHSKGFINGFYKLWSDRGQLIEFSQCVNGKYHGDRFIFEENKSVLLSSDHCWAKYSYSTGQTHGPFHKWHMNSKIWLTGENRNGKIHGMLSEYNNQGFRVFKTMYQDGREIWSRLAFGN